MAQSLDIYIDTTSGTLLAAGSARNGTLPTLTRNDSYNLRVRLQERDQGGFLRDLDLTGSSIKLGIGSIDGDPTDGQFKLILNSITSNAISFNATPLQVYTAISGIAGTGVTVTTYGNENYAYLITSATANTAMSFGGSAFTLFPTSSVLVSTRRFPASSVAAQQVIRLVRNPAVFADTFVASPTAGVLSLTRTQIGSTTKNETYNLAVGSDAEGGSVVLNFGANSTTAIPIGATATSFAEALSAVTGVGSGNVSVDVGNNAGDYSISFVRNLGLTALTNNLTLDANGVIFGSFLQTTCTLATAELDELFAEAGTDTITPKIEVELTQNGTPKTVLQTDVTVRRDLLTTGSAIPAAQASYLTAAESYAAFVEDSTSNVDATNRKLYNSSSQVFLDWQSNTIGTGTTILDLSGTAVTITDGYNLGVGTTTGTKIGVSTSSKLAFFGSTPITQPGNTNVVSALVNLGLIANTVTVGVTGGSSNAVTDWIGNVSATTRFLADSSAVTSVDWGNRVLKTSTGATAINWELGTFGSGSTVVTIAANNVAISGSYYIAMGTGNGAFRTLSTLASVTFGSVAANDQHYRDVVVTGAAVNDIVLIGLPSAVSAGAVIQGVAYKTNTVCLSCTNADTASLAINTATYRITLLNYQ